jgi:hypothetical protein
LKGIVEESNWEKLNDDKIMIYVGEKDYPKSKNTYSTMKDKKITIYAMHFIVTHNDEMYKKLFKILQLTEEAEWKRPRVKKKKGD